ncbi:MAG: PdxA family dehydrogenase [Elusimicrobiota bacterium]
MAKKIFITMGDPRGIGPSIIFNSLKEIQLEDLDITIIGDKRKLSAEADKSGFAIGQIKISDIKISGNAGADSVAFIDRALLHVCHNPGSALVTAPVEKRAAASFKEGFRGHTEYIAEFCKVENPVMSFISDKLKMSLVTTHLPLEKVASKIKKAMIERHVKIINSCLKKHFNINTPRIVLCSLNPHCGEEGLLGAQEAEEMKPAVEALKKKNVFICGPLSPSYALKECLRGRYDFLVSPYHDQILPALKAFMAPSVNLTMGLPFIRTSPDHGPAVDLPSGRKADYSAMKKAIELAGELAG